MKNLILLFLIILSSCARGSVNNPQPEELDHQKPLFTVLWPVDGVNNNDTTQKISKHVIIMQSSELVALLVREIKGGVFEETVIEINREHPQAREIIESINKGRTEITLKGNKIKKIALIEKHGRRIKKIDIYTAI